MFTESLRGPRRRLGVRAVLHLLWLVALLVACRGLLGAWIAPSLTDASRVQICTPLGMQWLVLGEVQPGEDLPDPGEHPPCLGASLHAAVWPSPTPVPRTWSGACAPVLEPDAEAAEARHRWDHARRVLLMAAMRAPPQGLKA